MRISILSPILAGAVQKQSSVVHLAERVLFLSEISTFLIPDIASNATDIVCG